MIEITYCPPGYALGYVPQGQEKNSAMAELAHDVRAILISNFNPSGKKIQLYEEARGKSNSEFAKFMRNIKMAKPRTVI